MSKRKKPTRSSATPAVVPAESAELVTDQDLIDALIGLNILLDLPAAKKRVRTKKRRLIDVIASGTEYEEVFDPLVDQLIREEQRRKDPGSIVITDSDIRDCEITSFYPPHYRSDGSCLCDERPAAKREYEAAIADMVRMTEEHITGLEARNIRLRWRAAKERFELCGGTVVVA